MTDVQPRRTNERIPSTTFDQVKAIRQFNGTRSHASPAANKRLCSKVGRHGNGDESVVANDMASTISSTSAADSKLRTTLSGKKLQSEVVSDRKAVVTLASVVAAFAVCWVPYFVLFVLKPFLANPIDQRIDQLALWLGYVNSGVNPFLYAFHSTSFRGGFRRVLCRRQHFRSSLASTSTSTAQSHRRCTGGGVNLATTTVRLETIAADDHDPPVVKVAHPGRSG